VSEERHLLVVNRCRDVLQLRGVGQAQADERGRERGPIPGVQRHQQRLRVIQAPRHPDGLLAQGRLAVCLVGPVQRRGQPGEHLGPQQAVALRKRGQGLLKQVDIRRLTAEHAGYDQPDPR
jgi:hypothetical protein